MTYKILKGNSLDLLPTLADNSIDAIVTDPPYGLGNPDPDYIIKAIQQWASGDRSHIPEGKGFMGKSWDSFVPPPAIWDECLRVLKPGGHLLAFAGTRTYDLMGISIRMAGFEIRDSIGWVYGSGFPKSLDVSKAIDKNNGKITKLSDFTIWMRTTGTTVRQVTEALRAANLISENGTMASHYFATSESSQPAIPTAAMWRVIRPMIAQVPDWADEMVARIEAEREVIGSKMTGIANKDEKERHTIGASKAIEVDITAPSTPEAKQWQGWGTALKPALEPIVVARKPLGEKTVAANVLTHGTGGLNIDASRIGTTDSLYRASSVALPENQEMNEVWREKCKQDPNWVDEANKKTQEKSAHADKLGRWPANLILDEYTAELLDEQSGQSGTSTTKTGQYESRSEFGGGQINIRHPDSGGASRFFYVAKASKRDRNEGLEDFPDAPIYPQNNSLERKAINSTASSKTKNHHPTVKPTALMRYLVKLITPPGGTVLDPFTGSGSTGKAAILEGFDFIGIELTEDYWQIIEGRLKHAEAKVAEAKENQEAQPE
jgi:DNA modification methylase